MRIDPTNKDCRSSSHFGVNYHRNLHTATSLSLLTELEVIKRAEWRSRSPGRACLVFNIVWPCWPFDSTGINSKDGWKPQCWCLLALSELAVAKNGHSIKQIQLDFVFVLLSVSCGTHCWLVTGYPSIISEFPYNSGLHEMFVVGYTIP